MAYYVRMMRREDIAQIAEIDREAFPTQWPPANYRRELENRLAHYIVACDKSKKVEEAEFNAVPEASFTGLATKLRRFFNYNRFLGNEVHSSTKEYIVGFAGIWIMADEAHITNIAMRESYRRLGVGELLLISIVDLATELNAQFITLEVRTTNTAAQSLYRKYGFTHVGLRRGYYTDNGEDAILMTTENIISAPYQAQLQQLKQAHSRKWGVPLYQIAQ